MDWKQPLTAFLNGRDPRLLALLRDKYLAAAASARRRWPSKEYPDRVAELFLEQCFVEALEARSTRLRPRWRAAIRAYRRLLDDTEGETPDTLFLRGYLLFAIGKHARALHHFRRYLRGESRPEQRAWLTRACRMMARVRLERARALQ